MKSLNLKGFLFFTKMEDGEGECDDNKDDYPGIKGAVRVERIIPAAW